MRARYLRTCMARLAAVVVLLCLTACGADPATDDAPAMTTAPPTPTVTPRPEPLPPPEPTPAPVPAPTPSPTAEETAWGDLPPELAAVLPETEAEMDELVLDAEEAYRAHRAAYDAAAATGFTDRALMDELMAGAGWRTLESLESESAALVERGYAVDGATDIIGLEIFGISPPEEGWPGLGLVFDVCLDVHGTLHDRDGTVVREVGGEPDYLQARLMQHEDGWLVMEQSEQEGPCPEHLHR